MFSIPLPPISELERYQVPVIERQYAEDSKRENLSTIDSFLKEIEADKEDLVTKTMRLTTVFSCAIAAMQHYNLQGDTIDNRNNIDAYLVHFIGIIKKNISILKSNQESISNSINLVNHIRGPVKGKVLSPLTKMREVIKETRKILESELKKVEYFKQYSSLSKGKDSFHITEKLYAYNGAIKKILGLDIEAYEKTTDDTYFVFEIPYQKDDPQFNLKYRMSKAREIHEYVLNINKKYVGAVAINWVEA